MNRNQRNKVAKILVIRHWFYRQFLPMKCLIANPRQCVILILCRGLFGKFYRLFDPFPSFRIRGTPLLFGYENLRLLAVISKPMKSLQALLQKPPKVVSRQKTNERREATNERRSHIQREPSHRFRRTHQDHHRHR